MLNPLKLSTYRIIRQIEYSELFIETQKILFDQLQRVTPPTNLALYRTREGSWYSNDRQNITSTIAS